MLDVFASFTRLLGEEGISEGLGSERDELTHLEALAPSSILLLLAAEELARFGGSRASSCRLAGKSERLEGEHGGVTGG